MIIKTSRTTTKAGTPSIVAKVTIDGKRKRYQHPVALGAGLERHVFVVYILTCQLSLGLTQEAVSEMQTGTTKGGYTFTIA